MHSLLRVRLEHSQGRPPKSNRELTIPARLDGRNTPIRQTECYLAIAALGGGHLLGTLLERKENAELGPDAHFALDLNPAVMAFHDPARQR